MYFRPHNPSDSVSSFTRAGCHSANVSLFLLTRLLAPPIPNTWLLTICIKWTLDLSQRGGHEFAVQILQVLFLKHCLLGRFLTSKLNFLSTYSKALVLIKLLRGRLSLICSLSGYWQNARTRVSVRSVWLRVRLCPGVDGRACSFPGLCLVTWHIAR